MATLDEPAVVAHHVDDFEQNLAATVEAGSRLAPFDDFVTEVAGLAKEVLAAIGGA